MFTKKTHADIKKSTAKLQDCKKDSGSRLRHLRTILDNVDNEDAKSLFETNYSHIYYVLYDTFIQAEANLKLKVHKAHREELDSSLWLLEKVLCLTPEILARRWQCHSLSRIMAKLLHLGNSPKLRKEGVRYFLLWYQALADHAPMYVHTMYTDLIPGLIVPQKGIIGPDVEFSSSDFLNHPNMKVDGTTTSVSHDTFSHPVQSVELIALLPPSSNEKSAPPDPRDGLETLLNSMVQTTACLRWRDNRAQKDQRAFSFLLQRFKDVFLPIFCPNFDFSATVYEPRLQLPTLRVLNKKEEFMSSCVVVLINWISRFTHERLLSNRLDNMSIVEVDHMRLLAYQQGLIVRDVLYSSKANVDFIHEIYRQALLLGFKTKAQIDAIRTTIAVYRDWMTCSTPPPFLLEPEDGDVKFSESIFNSPTCPARNQRLRTASYVDAINKENVAVRAGLQNILQVFVTNAANVFLVNTGSLNINFPTKSRDYRSTPMHEQTEVCKKVLNVYRTMVMNTHMSPKTWEQLLLVLLQVTATVLHQGQSTGPKQNSLGSTLGQAIFQTLIVTWIRAHTNVPVNVQLWEKFLNVLSSLTYREELIIEWDKTIQTLTRVFSRYVYALNLQDLPLDRLAESKGKRRRIGSVWQQSATVAVQNSRDNERQGEKKLSISSRLDRQIPHGRSEQLVNNPLQQALIARSGTSGTLVAPTLNRSYSEGSLASTRASRTRRKQRNTHETSLLAQQTVSVGASASNETLNSRKYAAQTDIRRALSLDSLVDSKIRHREQESVEQGSAQDHVYDDDDGSDHFGSRSPSPSASSGGIESGSMQDAGAMQIDVLTVDACSDVLEDGNAMGSVERRSIVLGGNATGWLPDSTAVMWKRMLGALGDVNRIPKPELHAKVFKHLLDLTFNLIKIKQNLGVSPDNLRTPPQPTLVPPIGIVAPWCYGALDLDQSFKQGKLYAVQTLCTLAVYGAVSNMQQLSLFYYAIHKLLTGEDRDLIYVVLKHLDGPRFLSLLLPGHTLLLLDIVHSAAILLTSLEANRSTPRAEVAALLGSLLCYPASLIPEPLLQPSPQQFALMECADLQDHILNILLRCARRDPSSKARCIALAQLGQWVFIRLQQTPSIDNKTKSKQHKFNSTGFSKSETRSTEYYNPRIREVLQVLLQALQFKHRTIAIVAVDSLKLCVEYGRKLADIEQIPHLIITAICKALEIQQVASPKETDKAVLTALMLCLGEFCMAFPPQLLLVPFNDQADSIVLIVLRVLLQIAAGAPRHERVKLTADDDFDMHIASDDLLLDGRISDANYQTSETIQSCISAIRLCAKAVSMHLVTYLGHFPMGIGASRLSSLVEEHDDWLPMGVSASSQQENNPDLRRDSAEICVRSVINAQNMQLFMLSSGLVSTLIELPALKLPGGGVTAGLVTAEKQVRVLLRDLNGKACWDASILYSEPRRNAKQLLPDGSQLYASGSEKHTWVDSKGIDVTGQRHLSQPNDSLISSIVGLEIISHRQTLRHRPAGELPLARDLATDLDQLDDLLAYIGHTSSECLPFSSAQLNAPAPSPLGGQLEAQAISIILNQRALEMECIMNINQLVSLPLDRGSGIGNAPQNDQQSTHSAEHASQTSFESYNTTSLSNRSEVPFQYCRLLFSHLGLAGWERRSCTNLLHRTEKLLRELRNVDLQKCRETHKMAVIYVGPGQEDKSSILHNASGSNMYEMFVSALGWEIELESHNGFLGGLSRQGCGATAPYFATPFLEVIYHVATRMPSDSPEAILLKTRHLGNDEVHIVWSEHNREYRRDILPTEFCDVLIVVYPLRNGLFRVTVSRKPEVPWFGPLPCESVVNGTCLAILIRATAINASRAKRSALPLYQQYYEERNRSLDSVSSRYKESTTFEDFAGRIYHPTSVLSYGALPDSGVTTSLAVALIDHQRSAVKGWVQASIDADKKEIALGTVPYTSATSTAAMEHTSSSPRGARRSQPFKSASKKTALYPGNTPPESPTLQLRRFK